MSENPTTVATRRRRLGGRRFLLSLCIVGAAVCLALGVSQPIIKVTKYVFFTTEHSLISTVATLIKSGQTFLGVTVLVFSIVLPVLKLLYLVAVSVLPSSELQRQKRRLIALEWLGKWSMHDVLVLSLTIFFIKSQGVWDAASLKGVYFFTAAVILMILAYAFLRYDAVAPAVVHVEPVGRPSPVRNFALSFLIILATVFFALGVILPVIRFTTVYVWTNEHSLSTIIWALYSNEEYFLCVVIFIFSIFFPFLKLFYLLTLMTSPDLSPEFRRRSASTMEWLGRYSMTDVMVLALMIFYFNSSDYTEASVLPGAYFFAASVLMTMLAYGWANSVTPSVAYRASEPAEAVGAHANASGVAALPSGGPVSPAPPPSINTSAAKLPTPSAFPVRPKQGVRADGT